MRARKMLTSPALLSSSSSRSASTRASSARSAGATGSRPGSTGCRLAAIAGGSCAPGNGTWNEGRATSARSGSCCGSNATGIGASVHAGAAGSTGSTGRRLDRFLRSTGSTDSTASTSAAGSVAAAAQKSSASGPPSSTISSPTGSATATASTGSPAGSSAATQTGGSTRWLDRRFGNHFERQLRPALPLRPATPRPASAQRVRPARRPGLPRCGCAASARAPGRCAGRHWPSRACGAVRRATPAARRAHRRRPSAAPLSTTSRNDSTSWLRSPMARMPAMRAPPFSVCSSRLSSVTCARSARSARQRESAASDCSSSSVASSPKIAAMSASKSTSSVPRLVLQSTAGERLRRQSASVPVPAGLRAAPCGQHPRPPRGPGPRSALGSEGSVSSSCVSGTASSMTTPWSAQAARRRRACAPPPPRDGPARRRAAGRAPASPP